MVTKPSTHVILNSFISPKMSLQGDKMKKVDFINIRKKGKNAYLKFVAKVHLYEKALKKQ